MATDSQTAINGDGFAREQRGRFGKGNRGGPGRKPGPTPQTMTLERIKQAVIQSWSDVDGPKLLSDLAANDPRSYLRLVVGLLPREQVGESVVQQRLVFFKITPAVPPEQWLQPTIDQPTDTYRDVPQLPVDVDE